jgi:hypothetical protein
MQSRLRTVVEPTLLVLAAFVVVASMFSPVRYLHRDRDRAEARSLYDYLQPGMARSEVQAALTSGKYPHLRLWSQDPSLYVVSTPLLSGAGNWQLRVEFQAERVSAVRVRTADSHEYAPPDAPPDKRNVQAVSQAGW